MFLADQSYSASVTPDSLFSFPNSPMSQRGGEPSAASSLSPAEEVPLLSYSRCVICGLFLHVRVTKSTSSLCIVSPLSTLTLTLTLI